MICATGSTHAKADFWSDAKNAVQKGAHDTGAAVQKGAHDTGTAIEKGAHDTGTAIQKGAHDTGTAVVKGAHDSGTVLAKAVKDTGAAINKANSDLHPEVGRTWDNINHALKEGEKFLCSFFTAGQSEQGNASCSVSGGVGVSTNGSTPQPYTFDPANPDQHYPIGVTELTLPSPEELAGMNRILGPPPDMQDWERREDAVLQLFLNPGDRIGLPWVNASSETRFPNGNGEVRQPGGGFLDRRHDERYPGGYRYHGGIDYVNHTGDTVFSPVSGTIIRSFPPSEPGMLGRCCRVCGGIERRRSLRLVCNEP